MEVKINTPLLDSLTAQAKCSPRLRMNYDLRDSEQDSSQRMLNAIEPGSAVPIHRHMDTSETVVCLRGHLKWIFHNPDSSVAEIIELKAGGSIAVLNVPAGQWHSVESIESGSVILEMKDGAYKPLDNSDILWVE